MPMDLWEEGGMLAKPAAGGQRAIFDHGSVRIRPIIGAPHPIKMSLAPGTRLGPYEVVSAIGAGGMGEVYRVRDARLDKANPQSLIPNPGFVS